MWMWQISLVPERFRRLFSAVKLSDRCDMCTVQSHYTDTKLNNQKEKAHYDVKHGY